MKGLGGPTSWHLSSTHTPWQGHLSPTTPQGSAPHPRKCASSDPCGRALPPPQHPALRPFPFCFRPAIDPAKGPRDLRKSTCSFRQSPRSSFWVAGVEEVYSSFPKRCAARLPSRLWPGGPAPTAAGRRAACWTPDRRAAGRPLPAAPAAASSPRRAGKGSVSMTGPFEGPTSGVLTSLVLPGFHMSFNSLLTFTVFFHLFASS